MTPESIKRCKRCSRVLKSLKSIAHGYGPSCWAKVEKEKTKPEQDGRKETDKQIYL